MKVVSRIIDKQLDYEDVAEYPFSNQAEVKRFLEHTNEWLKSVGYTRYEKDGKDVFIAPNGIVVEYELII